jgi:hypothetical protein
VAHAHAHVRPVADEREDAVRPRRSRRTVTVDQEPVQDGVAGSYGYGYGFDSARFGNGNGRSTGGVGSGGSSSSASAGSGGAGAGGAGSGGTGGSSSSGTSGAGGWHSDRRLKRRIVRLGRSPSGLDVYRFQYIWGGPHFVGVMAQDILPLRPDAVSVDPYGFLVVDYTKLDVDMMTLGQWRARRKAADLLV